MEQLDWNQAFELIAVDASVASSDAALILDRIAVFESLGGGWRPDGKDPP